METFPILHTVRAYSVETSNKGRHKKTAERVKTVSLGGGRSEKLMNFHHLQMIKSMEGGGSHSIISLLCGTQL